MANSRFNGCMTRCLSCNGIVKATETSCYSCGDVIRERTRSKGNGFFVIVTIAIITSIAAVHFLVTGPLL